MLQRSVLIIAFLICLPILWSALVDQSVSLEAAGVRFLIALPVAAFLVGLVRIATRAPHADEDLNAADADAPHTDGTSH
ncbi:MAG: hypothetical protein ABI382_04750 [Nakamurella sp.]